MPADRTFGALVIASDRWLRAYAECQVKQAGIVDAYDTQRDLYLRRSNAK
jgi:hypothetical protein